MVIFLKDPRKWVFYSTIFKGVERVHPQSDTPIPIKNNSVGPAFEKY